MATTFKAELQKRRKDGTHLIYIRVTHNREKDYIKTGMYIHESKVKSDDNGKKLEINDAVISGKCAMKIKGYMDVLRYEDTESWSIKEIMDLLTIGNTKIPFIPFCKQYILNMRKDGRGRTADNYENALKSFLRHNKNEDITFQDLRSKMINAWIKEHLSQYARIKEMYPTHLKTMFKAGKDEYNDYESEVPKIRIGNDPFKNVVIPKADVAIQKAVEADVLRKLFAVKPNTRRSELAQDVALLTIYMVGINTVDLFETKEDAIVGDKICYNRWKEKKVRRDKAYIEITIRPEIKHLFEKYKGKDGFLFDFGYKDNINFNRNFNKGLKHLCKLAGVPEMKGYALRHTWATIAQEDCGAVTPLVAYCMNHSSEFKVTELYIKKKFKPIDDLNDTVLEYIFGKKDKPNKRKKALETECV